MLFAGKEVQIKDGRTVRIRNADIADSADLIRFLKITAAIAIYQEYWGLGLGQQMMAAVLERAEASGYEQVELEVCEDNQNAIALYQKLGFSVYGTLKHDMKYKDGRYADSHLMVKYFERACL